MNIAIVGGGAIGLLFANYLTKANHHVTLIVRRTEQEKVIRTQGVQLFPEESSTQVNTLTFDECQGHAFDLVIVTVKQTAVKAVVDKIKNGKLDATAFLFVQNGMSHIYYMKELLQRYQNIYIGVVEHGAKKLSDNNVHHTGVGKVSIGSLQQNDPTIYSLAKGLTYENFPFFVENDWEKIMKQKLMINAVINPLTALFRISNGELLLHKHFISLMESLFNEAITVLHLDHKEELWQRLIEVCTKTASNHSSMLVDLTEGRETEIDAISGYILKQAELQSVDVPYTTFVYKSIKGISAMYDNKD